MLFSMVLACLGCCLTQSLQSFGQPMFLIKEDQGVMVIVTAGLGRQSRQQEDSTGHLEQSGQG